MLSTNGLGLDRDWLERLRASKKSILTLSMDGHPDDHRKLRRALNDIPDAYDHVVSLLDELHRTPRVVVTQTIAPTTAVLVPIPFFNIFAHWALSGSIYCLAISFRGGWNNWTDSLSDSKPSATSSRSLEERTVTVFAQSIYMGSDTILQLRAGGRCRRKHSSFQRRAIGEVGWIEKRNLCRHTGRSPHSRRPTRKVQNHYAAVGRNAFAVGFGFYPRSRCTTQRPMPSTLSSLGPATRPTKSPHHSLRGATASTTIDPATRSSCTLWLNAPHFATAVQSGARRIVRVDHGNADSQSDAACVSVSTSRSNVRGRLVLRRSLLRH